MDQYFMQWDVVMWCNTMIQWFMYHIFIGWLFDCIAEHHTNRWFSKGRNVSLFQWYPVGDFYKYLESSPEVFFFAVQNPNKKQVASVEETDSDAFPEHKWRTLPDPIIMPSFGEFCKVMYFIRVRWTNCQFPQILSMEFETHLQRKFQIPSNSTHFEGWNRETKITTGPKIFLDPNMYKNLLPCFWHSRMAPSISTNSVLWSMPSGRSCPGPSPEPTPKGWLPSSLVCSVVIR